MRTPRTRARGIKLIGGFVRVWLCTTIAASRCPLARRQNCARAQAWALTGARSSRWLRLSHPPTSRSPRTSRLVRTFACLLASVARRRSAGHSGARHTLKPEASTGSCSFPSSFESPALVCGPTLLAPANHHQRRARSCWKFQAMPSNLFLMAM